MSPANPSLDGRPGRARRASRLCLPLLGASLLLVGLTACSGKSEAPQKTLLQSAAPTFTTSLTDITVLAGGKATFTVAATGSPAFQWTRNGALIPGAYGTSYTTAEATLADNNAVYGVTAQTGAGSVSSFGTLHVNYATITTDLFDTAVAPGQPATLTLGVAGSGTLAYQWSKNGADIAGATGATYALASAGTADSAAYACKVTSTLNGTVASATSKTARLSVVTAAPVITVQPASLTVAAGDKASFSVTATDAATYQWYKGGYPIPGATDATCTLPVAIGGDDGAQISVAVTNPLGQVTSIPVTLHVNYLRFTQQPAAAVAAEGKALTLSAGIAASGATTYQWYKSDAPLSGANQATYPVAALSPADAGTYTCVCTSQLGGTTITLSSDPALIQVVGLPSTDRQITGATGSHIVGTPLNLSIAATQVGSGNMAYQWFKDGVALKDVQAKPADPVTGIVTTAVVGSQLPSLYIQSLAPTDTGVYTCTITNTYKGIPAQVTSLPASVAVTGTPVITVKPVNVTVLKGRPATFSLKADGVPTMAYQWYRGGSAIPGATANAYTFTTTVADNGATFTCKVSNTWGNVISDPVTLTVNSAPAATTFQASRQLITRGQGVVFTYSFDDNATATFGPKGGTGAPVTSLESTTVYPDATATYTLTVTLNGVATATDLPVTVKTYTPTFFYAVNQKDATITQVPVNPGATLKTQGNLGSYYDPTTATGLMGSPQSFLVTTGNAPNHIAATWDEKFIYVVNTGDATISGYTVDGATSNLVPMTGSPFLLPFGQTQPWSSAPDPSGKFLFVSCKDGVAVMAIDPTTGALTDTGHAYAIPGRVQGDLLVHPSGKYLYAADPGDSVLKSFTIDPATGALAPNGPDMAITYPSGVNLSFNTTMWNGSNLAFDRAANVIFTRSDDTQAGSPGYTATGMNAAFDSYQVDPYTGTLRHLATSQGPFSDTTGNYLIMGTHDAVHSLVYSAMPGVDHLLNTYVDGYYQTQCLSEYPVNMDPLSATFGSVPGYYANPNWGPGPWGNFSFTILPLATAITQDRSGRIYCGIMGATKGGVGYLVAWGSDAQGNIALMGYPGTGSISRKVGIQPIHGLFLGTLN